MIPQGKISLIFTVEPVQFFANPETVDNFFQIRPNGDAEADSAETSQSATIELQRLRDELTKAQVANIALNGPENRPDAIFPNNSFSIHERDERRIVILYPMSKGRRNELSNEFINFLEKISDGNFYDLRKFEREEKYLEGTGSLNFDGEESCIYMGRSDRASIEVMEVVADILKIW